MLGAGPARPSALGVALRSLLAASRFSLCASSPSRSIRQGPLSKCPTCHPCSELARDSPAPWERPEQGRRFNCSSEDLCEHGQDRTWTVTLAARAARLSHLQNQIYQKAKSSEDRSHKEIWSKGGGEGPRLAGSSRTPMALSLSCWVSPEAPAPTPAAGGPPSSTRIVSSRTTGGFCPAVSVHCKSQTDVWPCQTPNEPLSLP